ncbi:MAG: MFS transporter [Candidatus Bathyarchaeota archaeon]|nr:MFS transporter [Candidatus Bathyarchaeota archaeon]
MFHNAPSRFFWTLCFIGLFAILSSTMSKNPVLKPFSTSLGTPEALLGIVAAASTIPGILVSFPAGWLSDVFGRRKLLFTSCVVFASAPFLYLFVSSWWQLVLVRFYHGFATAIFVPVSNATIAELFPTKRGERISTFSSATIIGRSVAPLLGGSILFITVNNYRELYVIVGVAGIISLFTALIYLKEITSTNFNKTLEKMKSRKNTSVLQDWSKIAGNKGILIVGILEASQYYTFGAVEFFLVGYLQDIATMNLLLVGIILGAQPIIISLTKPFMGKLSDKIGRRTPIIIGSLITSFLLIAIPLTVDFPILLVLSILYGLGFSLVTSSTPALVSELTQKENYGATMGFLATIMDIGQTIGPIMSGIILASTMGYIGLFGSLSTIILVTTGIFFASKTAKA